MPTERPRERVPPSVTRTEMTWIVLPTHTNNHDTAFGGQIAAWCDICAAVAAQRFVRGPVVTASMDSLHFLKPVKRGMVVALQGQVNRAWNTSMEVGVRVDAEDPTSGQRVHCCSAYLTFVALDGHGQPRPVPALDTAGDPEAELREREADIRRESRLAVRKLRARSRADAAAQQRETD
jgi:acyl-CoA hydrolase